MMLGIITLIIAIVVQLGYTIYCLRSKSRQNKIRLLIRVIALGILSLLLLLNIYQWGLRWILLFIVLSILAVSSILRLVLKVKEKQFSPRKTVFSGILGILLFIIAITPAIVFPQYEIPTHTGEYNVLTAEYTYVDSNRIETYKNTGENREVNVAFWYPEDVQGKLPLVVFSHGFCGINYSNESTYRELASHGYVVCSIDHPYHSFYTTNDKGKTTIVDMGYMQEYASQKDDKVENLNIFNKWMDIRVGDMSFVIDTILNSNGDIYDLVDHSKIGVFGHSLGAAAAMGVPRVRSDIDAVINLDGPMLCEFTGVENNTYTINSNPYPAPILNIYSQYLYDNGIEMNDEEYFQNRLVSATAPASYEVMFKGSQHMNFTDLVLASPVLANLLDSGRKAEIDKYYCIETMNKIILGFFNCYLKGEGEFICESIY